MQKLFLACFAAAVATPALAADVYVKTVVRTAPMTVMGQTTPARDDVNETWIGATKMATLSGRTATIVDLDRNVMAIVNHGEKSYVEAPLPFDLARLLPPEAAAMAAMMQVKVAVTPTAETKKIGRWDCTRYDATVTAMGMPMKLQIWATSQVPFDLPVFMARMMPAVVQGQMMVDAASLQEFAKIKGFQIVTETTGEMMGAKFRSTTEVVEMVEKSAPAGTYTVPAGYTRRTALSLEQLQRR